ncbi:MAG: hypothetical protein JWO68_3650, partial [Actinomycetia bacterium]|nr:hypothetical protein [Actinomycetes bacterium]
PLGWAAALAIGRVVRRRRRRASATTAGEWVLVAWDEVSEALARAGAPAEPWETPNEFATRAAATTGVDGRLLAGLAGLTTTALYAPIAIPDEIAEQSLEVAGTLERAADATVGWRERSRLLVDPRPLLPDRAARVDVREG